MAVAVVVGSAVLGGFFGGRVLAGQDRLDDQYEVFSTALAAVETTYVGEVDSEQLVYRATAGMLQRLDPHSNFMDPRNYARLRERQGGRYYGLGISINVINGDITVMSLFEGSPRVPPGHPARGRHRAHRGRGRQRHHQRRRRQAAPRPQGQHRHGVHPAAGLRRVDRSRGRAGRDSHPHGPGGVHDRRRHRVRASRRLLGDQLARAAAGPPEAGRSRHGATAARPAGQPRRAARPGHPGVEPVPAAGRAHRLYPRPDTELRPGLQRARGRRPRRHPPRGPGQPPERERGRDRVRGGPGSRPRPHRRRDDVREGAGAVGLPGGARGRPRADDGALLHPERAHDPAALGRDLRRVP